MTSMSDSFELLVMPKANTPEPGARQASSDIEKDSHSSNAFFNEDIDTLSWQNLSVSVKDRTRGQMTDILHGASGIAYPGEMMALMGPSGSGKTTLLNTLAQRQTASVEGKVLVNGAERSLETHRALSAFVEQEDTLTGSLTVQETLHFAARLALPRSINKVNLQARVRSLIDAFGLQRQCDTLIGTPLQKGLSGGQKRRVSVATQLITGPRILYLDEPTSGLDSKASYEIMSFLRNIARKYKLIIVASIHQPSTKTFELFDQVILLSQGKTCYYGSIPEMPPFFDRLSLRIPPMTNPAEHILDLTNVDFSLNGDEDQARLDRITDSWRVSAHAQELERTIHNEAFQTERHRPLSRTSVVKPSPVAQIATLLHRAFIKSYRDLVAYWVRVAMYMGLAIMMGTVWLRLGTTQQNIQPFINAIFFGSAFMSFMAVAYVPAFLEDRAIFVKERANGLYGPTAFLVTNFIIGLPYLFLIDILFSVVSYWLTNFRPTASAFFTWVMWIFLDLVAAESLVVFMASLFPNFVVSLALIAFANGLWMSVGGFLVSMPVLNVFWKYVFHYIDYQAYVFQGMMVNEFKARDYDCARIGNGDQCQCIYPSELQRECKVAGTAVLKEYGYSLGHEGEWVGILIAIIVVYRLLAWGVTYLRKT